MTEEKSRAPWDIDETAEQTIDLARGAMESLIQGGNGAWDMLS